MTERLLHIVFCFLGEKKYQKQLRNQEVDPLGLRRHSAGYFFVKYVGVKKVISRLKGPGRVFCFILVTNPLVDHRLCVSVCLLCMCSL